MHGFFNEALEHLDGLGRRQLGVWATNPKVTRSKSTQLAFKAESNLSSYLLCTADGSTHNNPQAYQAFQTKVRPTNFQRRKQEG